jgi:hypothetical protein
MNFYTSASNYLRFLVLFVGIYLLAIQYAGYVERHVLPLTDNDLILAQRLDKIAKTDDVVIAFVGDSSLGNAIDETRVGEAFGSQAVNLGLTGSFGVEGSLNMLRRTKARWPDTLKTVVIMQTVDMFTRAVTPEGYMRTLCDDCVPVGTILRDDDATGDGRLMAEYAVNRVFHYQYITRVMKRLMGHKNLRVQPFDPAHDYIQQGENAFVKRKGKPLTGINPSQLNLEKFAYLKQIDTECKNLQLNCVFAYGPVYQEVADLSADYMAEMTKRIQSNWSFAGPVPSYLLQKEQVGDSLDHAATSAKADVTDYYIDQLKNVSN